MRVNFVGYIFLNKVLENIVIFQNEHKLKPFHGAKVCFLGFSEEEERHMKEVLLANGGLVSALDDAECSHVVSEFIKTNTY